MLLIIYAAVLVFLSLPFTIYPIIRFIIELAQGNKTHLWHFIVGLIGLVLSIVFTYIIIQFITYHFELIRKNMTTIEHLDEKRGNVREYNYDYGKDFNWDLVFGKRSECWFIPFNKGDAGSQGDGIV